MGIIVGGIVAGVVVPVDTALGAIFGSLRASPGTVSASVGDPVSQASFSGKSLSVVRYVLSTWSVQAI